ncbi:MAG: metalloregulator ArsR/SmtB family transcription factor [Calditrichota bacterium]|jgi:ArsR family transcriptional regulator
MAQNKSNLFNPEEIELAEMAKALSHPARIKILNILIDKNVCMCGDIVDLLPLAQSTVSQHLRELKRVGLIQGEIEGLKTCYCLDHSKLKKAKEAFQLLFTTVCQCD